MRLRSGLVNDEHQNQYLSPDTSLDLREVLYGGLHAMKSDYFGRDDKSGVCVPRAAPLVLLETTGRIDTVVSPRLIIGHMQGRVIDTWTSTFTSACVGTTEPADTRASAAGFRTKRPHALTNTFGSRWAGKNSQGRFLSWLFQPFSQSCSLFCFFAELIRDVILCSRNPFEFPSWMLLDYGCALLHDWLSSF